MNIIIGNILSIIGSLFMIYSGYKKDKSSSVKLQIIQMPFFILSSLVLHAYAGVVLLIFGLIRNILAYYKILEKIPVAIILALIPCPIVFYVSNNFYQGNNIAQYVGMLPLIAYVFYTIGMGILKDDKKYKQSMIFFYILWAIYDFYFINIFGGLVDLFTVITSMMAIYKLNKG